MSADDQIFLYFYQNLTKSFLYQVYTIYNYKNKMQDNINSDHFLNRETGIYFIKPQPNIKGSRTIYMCSI